MIRRTDLIIPELLTEAIQGAFRGMTALWGTGAATTMFTMPTHGPTGAKLRGGDRIKVPYFGNLGELDDVPEGDALTPQRLSMTGEEAVVIHSGKAIEISNWAQLAASYADPYGEAARQFVIMVQRRADKALLDAAAQALPAEMSLDISVGAAPRVLDYDAMVDGKMLWGDEQNDILLMTVHSRVYGNLLKLKDSTGRPLLTQSMKEGEVDRFCGVPVTTSDRNMVIVEGTTTKYRSLILKRGALAWWANQAPTVKTDTDVLADTELAAMHIYHVGHRYSRTPGATRPGVVELITGG